MRYWRTWSSNESANVIDDQLNGADYRHAGDHPDAGTLHELRKIRKRQAAAPTPRARFAPDIRLRRNEPASAGTDETRAERSVTFRGAVHQRAEHTVLHLLDGIDTSRQPCDLPRVNETGKDADHRSDGRKKLNHPPTHPGPTEPHQSTHQQQGPDLIALLQHLRARTAARRLDHHGAQARAQRRDRSQARPPARIHGAQTRSRRGSARALLAGMHLPAK